MLIEEAKVLVILLVDLWNLFINERINFYEFNQWKFCSGF